MLSLLAPILGTFWGRLTEGKKTPLHPFLSWLERLIYQLARIDPSEEMTWGLYAKSLLWFNFFGFVVFFLVQRFQYFLPFNPENMQGVPWALSLNTALSFVTNTNWQAYAGETTMSYGTQMLGMTVQNFLSAATGSAVLMALVRGIIRKTSPTIGNYWADLVRTTVYLLLPLAFLLAIFLACQGVVQTLSPYVSVETLEGGRQTIPLGPAASQVAIKQIGSNGGGFFNVNSAHPFENPNVYTNFIELISMLAIPVSLIYGYGLLINSQQHARMLYGVALFIWAVGYGLSAYAEYQVNPVLDAFPLMEGKETRLGIGKSIMWSNVTTVSGNGSVNSMLESLSPLAGGVALMNMMLGEMIFGAIGTGLCSTLLFVMLIVFLCGLMVGRTPEYLGKKIEKKDVQWITLAILAPGILILSGAGISCLVNVAMQGLSSQGPHGLTELLYAFASAVANNGSAFAGIHANTDYYNIFLSILMVLGRLSIVVPSLAIAGNLASKKITPASSGTLSTNNFLFALLLFGGIFMICALTFIPALSLGPIVEHLLMLEGRSYPYEK